MTDDLMKAHLHRYLRTAREALLWKLDGLSEYDTRRPLTQTGTNLLGLVKHVASVSAEYLGTVFERPFPEPLPWFEDGAEDNADLWAAPGETREDIVGLWHRAWEHADATVEALDLDAPGRVPWWPDNGGAVTLGRVLVHLIAEINRHAGHADILREELDGAAGLTGRNANLPEHDEQWWSAYRDRIEAAAQATK
jgi:uncharacterized damage-inducible protein DinB